VLEITHMDDDSIKKVIYYFKDKKDYSSKRIVPKPADRQAIIQDAHNLGHYSVEKTAQNISNVYYWRNLWHQVEVFIDSCLTCLRFKRSSVLNHPAIAIPINDVMERIGIDLVLGLPLTESGYNGILVITEYLTKYPYAVAIRSKSAKEIARHLWHYFCLFGPAKELLSDCGKEFLNSVISEMLIQIGTIRRLDRYEFVHIFRHKFKFKHKFRIRKFFSHFHQVRLSDLPLVLEDVSLKAITITIKTIRSGS